MSQTPIPPVAVWHGAVSYARRQRYPRLGLIALATDLTSERDFSRLISPETAGIHTTRVEFRNPTTPENLRSMGPHLTTAAALLLPGEPLDAICYSCTAASIVIGDEEIQTAIGNARPGVPVVTPNGAARRALRALNAHRIALLTPYLLRTTEPIIAHFADHGFTVDNALCLGLDNDTDMARVDQDTIVEAAIAADHPAAEALFISCTALPSLDAIERIEARISKPVVTSNQASIWSMRQHAGLRVPIHGFGRLLSSGEGIKDERS